MTSTTPVFVRGIRTLAARFMPDPFVLLMLGAVVLGFLWPQGALAEGPPSLGTVTTFGISLVFFLHGAKLNPAALVSGLGQWQVHVLIQLTTFVLFPLLCYAIYRLTGSLLPTDLGIGLYFLGAVPSTIASSVAMTALARGNVPVAVFNASISGLIGMVATPFLMTLIGTRLVELSLIEAVRDIALQLLLPFALGQWSRPITAAFIARHSVWIGRTDRFVIALIVYGSFAKATADNAWSGIAATDIAIVIALVVAVLFTAIAATRFAARRLGLSRADEAALVFCGSKKSLATGAPMAQVLFAGSPSLSMVVLPLMIYHQVQLTVCAVLAGRYAAAAEADKPGSPAPTTAPAA